MCGLTGMAGDFLWKDKDLLKQLMVVCSVRGSHSTGIASVRQNTKQVRVLKCVGGPYDLFEQRSFDEVANVSMGNVFIAHGRHATRGEINKANAHPFQHGTIVGAHNGTLTSYSNLPIEKEKGVRFGTDSETLFANMAEFGVADTISEVRGAWALVWYDSADETLNFLRNDERPLWMCLSEDLNKMFWASELWMLQAMMHRHDVKVWKNDKEHRFFQFQKNRHYKYRVPSNSRDKIELISETVVEGNVTKPQVVSPFRTGFAWEEDNLDERWEKDEHGTWREIRTQTKDLPAPTHNQGGSGTTNRDLKKSQTQTGTSSQQQKPLLSSVPSSKRNNSTDSVRGFNGAPVSKDEFRKLTGETCGFCSSTIEYGDRLKWVSREIALCETCFPPEEKPEKIHNNILLLKHHVG